MTTVRLTQRLLNNAHNDSDKDDFLWDSEIKGFGVKLTPSGSRVFIMQYRTGGRGSPTRRYTIGKVGSITLEQARIEA